MSRAQKSIGVMLAFYGLATLALSLIQCGTSEMASDLGPSLILDGGRHFVVPGTNPIGANCKEDGDCSSAICELFASGERVGRCVATACKECFGLDPAGTSCVPVEDGHGSATCDGTCSTSYTGPSGVRTCCHQQCYCTIHASCGP